MHGGEGGHIVLKLPDLARDASKNPPVKEDEEEEDMDEDDESKLVIEDDK